MTKLVKTVAAASLLLAGQGMGPATVAHAQERPVCACAAGEHGGRLQQTEGDVLVTTANGLRDGASGTPLPAGSVLTTGPEASATVVFARQCTTQLGPNEELRVETTGPACAAVQNAGPETVANLGNRGKAIIGLGIAAGVAAAVAIVASDRDRPVSR